jgi:hypothetical protein
MLAGARAVRVRTCSLAGGDAAEERDTVVVVDRYITHPRANRRHRHTYQSGDLLHRASLSAKLARQRAFDVLSSHI